MERLDNLIINDYKLWQESEEFCFSIDAVLLAHFAKIKSNEKYADLGAGTGAISHIIVGRGAKNVVAFEINDNACRLLTKSINLNETANIITVKNIDYRQAHQLGYQNYFDGILVNPPYFKLGCGRLAKDKNISRALHETETTISEIITTSQKLLKFSGKLWIIYRSEQIVHLLSNLLKCNLIPKRMRYVHDNQLANSKLVLIECKYGAKEGLVVEPPLYIHAENGLHSEEIMAWYRRSLND